MTAAALAVLIGVDPFAVSRVTSLSAQAETFDEDRATNVSNALTGATPLPGIASAISGAWPAQAVGVLPAVSSSLPVAAEATVAIPSSTAASVDLGGMTVEVAETSEGETPSAVTVGVADPVVAESAGVTGVLLNVTDAGGGSSGAEQNVDLTVSYASFSGLIGGDWATRLRLVQIPECAAVTPDVPECQPVALESINDPIAQTVTGVVPVASATASAGAIAVAAGPSGPAGDWTQSARSPSSAWGTSGNTGAFTWSYPLQVPSGSGLAPELSISYSSAISDGRVPSANNQSGWIGEGFDLTSSYLERQYTPCVDDAKTGANNVERVNGDLCWGKENVTLVFNGGSSQLVHDSAAGVWRSKSDDGSKVELLTGGWNGAENGEYWKVTTVDGTQYYFGRGKATSAGSDLKSAWTVPVYGNNSGERCYKSSADGGFAASRCTQVWRWNLDHVVDPSGNTMTYTYATESNYYVADFAANSAWKTTAYVAGGHPTKIEYGTRAGSTATAPYRVLFDAQARCVTDKTDGTSLCADGTSESDKSKWLDTPSDLQCTAATTKCKNIMPVFFDTTRLAKVSAQAWDGTTYQNIDSWALRHRYVGEAGSNLGHVADAAVLTLDGITRTGHSGTISTGDDVSLPAIQFGYESLPNRVDTASDGQTGLWRPRIIQVLTDSRGAVNVAYRTECSAGNVPAISDTAQAANTRLCYLVKWQPAGSYVSQNHWFHKYVVDSVVEDGAPRRGTQAELITGSLSKTTRYEYLGGVKWLKPTGPGVDSKNVTYSDFRGFKQVATIVGEGAEQATTERRTYFRGSGDALTAGPAGHTVTVTDREEYAGQVFNSVIFNGSKKLTETITQPAPPVTVATGSTGLKSTRVPSSTTRGFTYDAAGALVHRTSTTTTNDAYGLPVTVDSRGDLTTTADDVCSRTTYRREGGFTEAHKVAYASKVEEFSTSCDGSLTAANTISRDVSTFDSSGRVIETKSLDPNNPAADIVRSRIAYDAVGRVTRSEDAAGNVTTTAYSNGAGGQLSRVVTTGPDPDGAGTATGFTSTQTFNPLTGLPIEVTDQNGLVTKTTYDALGRPTSVRLPQHAQASKPSIDYSYRVMQNGLNAVVTRNLGADGKTQHVSSVLYDGMLRPFQSQVETAQGSGRLVSHVYYDSTGRKYRQSSPSVVGGSPSGEAVRPQSVPPSDTTFEYDKAGRLTAEVLWRGTISDPANEKWRTTTVYDGAATLMIPPQGGTPIETVADALGRTIELREYVRDPALSPTPTTAAAVKALPKQTTKYTHDAAGRVTKMTNPAGDVWQSTFDAAGQLVSSVDPDAGTSTITYDVLGQVATRTNANGQKLAYTYDPLGRVTSLRDNSAAGAVRAQWTYDESEVTGGRTALGQLTSATRFVGGKEYTTSYPTYDLAYQPLAVDTSLPEDAALKGLSGASFTTEFAYAADGQVAQIVYPEVRNGSAIVLGKETVTTRFSDKSMPSWMGGGFGWGVYVAQARWTAEGNPLLMDLGNTYGAAVTWDWDRVTQRLNSVRLDRERVDGTEVNLNYSYDAAGNVTSAADKPTNAAVAAQVDAQCFRYDGLRRLKTAWTAANASCTGASPTQSGVGGVSPYWTDYEYDVLGNRTKMTGHAASGDTVTTYRHGENGAGPHQLTSMTKTTGGASVTTGFTWDAAGNQTSRTVDADLQQQTWDAEGELVSTTGGSAGTVSNVFDADGSRLVRTDASGATVYLPGGQEVTAGATGVTAKRWYSFAGQVVAVRTGIGMAGVTSVVTDAHGTPVAYVHNTRWNEKVQRVRTDPFGAARAGAAGAVEGRGFLGAPADASGLTLLGARFYDPGTGRFLSTDPELNPANPAQFNAYVYSGNNPMTWSDPSGRNWWDDMWNGVTNWAKDTWNGFTSGLNDMWKSVTGWVDENLAEITGFVAGAVVTGGCLLATGGVGSVGCAAAGGAVGSATTNVIKQARSGKPFDWGSLARDTAMGGLFGGVMGPLGSSVGKFFAPAAQKATQWVSSVFRSVTSRPRPVPAMSVTPATAVKKPATSCTVNSFVPGTVVLMGDGTGQAIETITVGDEVLATDPETGEQSARAVVATITGEGEKDLVTLTVTTGDGDTGEVTATSGHPFWVGGDVNDWVDAGQLEPGMWLRTSAGTWVQTTAAVHDHREQTVHNLTIDTTHTYNVYAGATDVLTHNCGETVPASGIRFSQNSVNGADEIAASMRAEGWRGSPIDVVRMPDGALTSVDNTRLLSAHLAGVDVRANIHAFGAEIPGALAARFPSRAGNIPATWGEAVANRILGQAAGFRSRYPNGAPFTGWDGN